MPSPANRKRTLSDTPTPNESASTTESTARSTLDVMADEFSIRARRARKAQGLPEVLDDPVALNKLAALIAAPAPTATPHRLSNDTR